MNAIQHALVRVTRSIPKEILQNSFNDTSYNGRGSPKSLEQRIKEEVILKMVLPDLNLTNGVWSYIPLNTAKMMMSDMNTYTYYIPKEATGGRSIMTVINISYTPGWNNYGYPAGNFGVCHNSMINRANQNLLNSISDIPVSSNTRCELIAENTVIIHDAPLSPSQGYLICILENDDELSIIKSRSIPIFSQLIVLATKAYIYNDQSIQVDRAQLYAGHELGKYKEILESYSDAMEQYQTMLDERIGKVFFMNSEENMTRHIRSMLGGKR